MVQHPRVVRRLLPGCRAASARPRRMLPGRQAAAASVAGPASGNRNSVACESQSSIYHQSIYLSTDLDLYTQAKKERLLYDMQRHGRPLDEDGEDNAIHSGPRAGHDTSEATSLPSSLPPSLPPGPPFSTSGGSSTSVALCLPGTNWEAVARRWHTLNPC